MKEDLETVGPTPPIEATTKTSGHDIGRFYLTVRFELPLSVAPQSPEVMMMMMCD